MAEQAAPAVLRLAERQYPQFFPEVEYIPVVLDHAAMARISLHDLLVLGQLSLEFPVQFRVIAHAHECTAGMFNHGINRILRQQGLLHFPPVKCIDGHAEHVRQHRQQSDIRVGGVVLPLGDGLGRHADHLSEGLLGHASLPAESGDAGCDIHGHTSFVPPS